MNTHKLQALIDGHIGKSDIHNIVLGVQSQDGAVDFIGAAGIADPATGAAMTPDTPYFVASITKMYTATVIVQLHQEGLLNLDDPISKHLPADLIQGIHVYEGTDYSTQLKIYQLVNQTSGLADYYEDKPEGGNSLSDDLKAGQDRALTVTQMMDIVRGLPPKFPPGAKDGGKAHYADTNYQLLGAIISAVTGKSVSENFQESIFAPLGLQHTYVFGSAQPQSAQTPAAIYMKERVLNMPKFLSSTGPDGGIVSTAAENLIFLRAFFDGKLFDSTHFERMMARWNTVFFPIKYGYGMMQFKMSRLFSPFKALPVFVGHSGSTGSFAFHDQKTGLYLVGTVNQIAAQRKPFQLMVKTSNIVT